MKTGRPFAVFDIDGTLIRWQLYHAISDHLVKLGFVDPSDYQAIKDARLAWKTRAKGASFKSYEKMLVESYEKNILGVTVAEFDQAVSSAFQEYKDQTYTFTRDLIAELKSKNYALFAISGSQTEIVQKIADYWVILIIALPANALIVLRNKRFYKRNWRVVWLFVILTLPIALGEAWALRHNAWQYHYPKTLNLKILGVEFETYIFMALVAHAIGVVTMSWLDERSKKQR